MKIHYNPYRNPKDNFLEFCGKKWDINNNVFRTGFRNFVLDYCEKRKPIGSDKNENNK